MEELTTQIGPAAATLVGLVAAVVQQFKRFAVVNEWQKKLPLYQILSLGLGIAGAHLFGLANPIFAGIIVGLSAGGAYDAVKTIPVPPVAKTVVPILLLALLCTGCGEKQMAVKPSVWLLSGANVAAADGENQIEDSLQYIGRVGLQSGSTELGATSSWWMGSNPRQAYGVYALQFIADPNGLLGTKPYVGVQGSLDVESDDGGLYGFMAGTIVPIAGLDIVTEFQMLRYNEALGQTMGTEDEKRVFVGLRFGF